MPGLFGLRSSRQTSREQTQLSNATPEPTHDGTLATRPQTRAPSNSEQREQSSVEEDLLGLRTLWPPSEGVTEETQQATVE
jgi:hypothetical protein